MKNYITYLWDCITGFFCGTGSFADIINAVFGIMPL